MNSSGLASRPGKLAPRPAGREWEALGWELIRGPAWVRLIQVVGSWFLGNQTERSQAWEGNRPVDVVMVRSMLCELGQGTWSWSLSFLTCKMGIMQGSYAQAWLRGSNDLRILEQGRSPDSCLQSQMLACVHAQSLQLCPTLRPHGL